MASGKNLLKTILTEPRTVQCLINPPLNNNLLYVIMGYKLTINGSSTGIAIF